MDNVYMNRGAVKLGFETTYGAGQVTNSALILRPWNVTMNDTVATIDTGRKRLGLLALAKDVLAGYQSGLIVLEGNLSTSDILLVKAAFLSADLDGTSGLLYFPHKLQGWDDNTNTASYSLAIYKLNPSAGTGYYDVATGCVCSDFKISGTSGDLVKFTATFRSQKPVKAQAVTFSGSAPTIVDACLNFGTDVSFTDGTNASMNSFLIGITNLFTADLNIYQNSVTRIRDIAIKTVVTNTVTRVKSDYDYLLDNLILDNTIQDMTFTLSPTSGDTWAFAMYGKYMDALLSTLNNDVIQQTMQFTGLWDATTVNHSIELTVS